MFCRMLVALFFSALFYGAWMLFIDWFMKDVEDRERDTDNHINW